MPSTRASTGAASEDRETLAFWEARAHERDWRALYEGPENEINHRFRARLRAVESLLEGVEPERVLDLGCGTGDYARTRRLARCSYVGLDASPSMLERASSGDRSNTRFVLGSASRLPFQAASFDLVLMIGLIGFLAEPRHALEEARRVLRPGGLLLVQGHRIDLFTGRGAAAGARPSTPRGERAWPRAELDRRIEPLGFDRTGFAYCDLRLLPVRLRRRIPRASIHLSRLLSVPGRTWTRAFAASCVAKYVRER